MKKIINFFIAWLHWGYQKTAKGVDLIRHPTLIPFYVILNYVGTTAYIYLGSRTSTWFCFFFSCIMFIYIIFCLYLYKCYESSSLRTFISWATFNGMIIWAWYIMCFAHSQLWAEKYSPAIPAFQALAGVALYIHYITVGKYNDEDTKQANN